MKTIFERSDYRTLKTGETYKDKFVIIKLEFLDYLFQDARYQLFYAGVGFGCVPSKNGGKIFGRWFDEPGVIRDSDVLGVATEEAIQQWEELYGLSREIFYGSVNQNK